MTDAVESKQPLLNVQEAVVVFNRRQPSQITALNHLSVGVREGDYITVVGSNGAGKSTLLNMIAGSVIPESGRVIFEGKDITHVPDFRRATFVARVFQNPLAGTSPAMSIEENFALAYARGSRRGLRLAVTDKRRELFCEKISGLGLGLEDRLSEPVSALSGGERQSLTVVMVTLKQPHILLLDEHTAALDPRMQKEVMSLTDSLVRENRLTTIMVTHNLEHALSYGNRMIMMHRGKILLELGAQEKSDMDIHQVLDLFHEQDAMLADSALMGGIENG